MVKETIRPTLDLVLGTCRSLGTEVHELPG